MKSQSFIETDVALNGTKDYVSLSDIARIQSQVNEIKKENDDIFLLLSSFDWRAINGLRNFGLFMYFLFLPIKCLYKSLHLSVSKILWLFKCLKQFFNKLSLWHLTYSILFELLALKEWCYRLLCGKFEKW